MKIKYVVVRTPEGKNVRIKVVNHDGIWYPLDKKDNDLIFDEIVEY